MTSEDLILPRDLTIIGLAARTRPAAAPTDIPALWHRFAGEGLGASLVAPGGPVYAVYCDYQSDHAGAYTIVLGVATPPDAPVPEGLRRVRIAAGRYARFPVAGPPAEVVARVWAHVNGEWERAHPRRYVADFERYDSATPAHVRADVCVGLLDPA